MTVMKFSHAEYLKHYRILPHGTAEQPQIKCLYVNNDYNHGYICKNLPSLSTYVQLGPQMLII